MPTSPPSFKGFSKPKEMKGFGRKRKQEDAFAPAKTEKVSFQTKSAHEQDVARALKDDDLTRRVLNLEKAHPYGTVPEMLAMDWLDKNLAEYVYQAKVNGGYRPGGLVPDFLVKRAGEGLALLIHGDYWHNIPGKREKDETDKLRLIGSYSNGVRIDDAVIVWESRLMRSRQARDEAMENALQKIELGA